MLFTAWALICVGLLTIAGGEKGRSDGFDEELMLKTETDIPINTISVQGVAGHSASLPCDTQFKDPKDAVTMVLWFKESTGEPVYSYDARSLPHGKTKLWSLEQFWGNRATFHATAPAQLVVQNVQEADAGEYRCRVDFRNSQSKNLKVNLTIIVPPLKPIIYDTKRRDMSEHLEAYPEGADLDLICEVHGGKPIPRVMWYLESQIINSSYEVKEMENPANIAHLPTAGMAKVPSTVIISRVKIKNLKRTHHRAKLSCRASNTNLAIPQTTTVIIELIMKPLEVLILSKEKVVSASKRYEITCRSSGSKPPASLSWYKGSKRLENSSRDFQEEGRSMSVLSWKPNAEDDGKYLTCRAENRRLPEATIEDKWKLKVHFAPIVQLRIGSTSGSRDIREGSDVSFECNVRSNPRNFKLTWYHGTKELRHNASAGIVLSDQSLVLQGITRDSSGNYSCVAANSEGRNRSNIIHLHVMFAPICKSLVPSATTKSDISSEEPATFELIDDNELESFNATSHKTLDLICEVEATPNDVTFHWTFNNSRGLVEVSDRKFSSEETVSRLRHLLRTDSDYGTFGCWASNIVGHSKQPCMYHVPTPVSPLPLQNCTAHNQSGSVIRISCVEGFDGGLPQKFVAVLDEQRHESHTPNWEIQIHKPSTVTLYAVNAKGSSDPVVIEGIAFKDVAKFTDAFSGETGIPLELSPILIGLGGTATGLGLIVTGVLMALWRKDASGSSSTSNSTSPSKSKPTMMQQQQHQHQQNHHDQQQQQQQIQPSIATFAVKGEEEDGNPDLIPTTALTNNYTDRKLSVYGSLPRGSNFNEDQMMPRSLLQEMHYPRAAPNTYYSLQRPTRYTESIVRHTTVQESCI